MPWCSCVVASGIIMRIRNQMLIKRLFIFIFIFIFIFSALGIAHISTNKLTAIFDKLSHVATQNKWIITQTTTLYDKKRNRLIPINWYVKMDIRGNSYKEIPKLPVVIINHGYAIKNTEYSFLAYALAEQGYFVVSIQHDLKTDATFPTTGNLYKQRKPLWVRGITNTLFVIKSLPKIAYNLDLTQVTLIGHSNGGDMVMLFTKKYPQLVKHAISLDNLRMPLPRSYQIPILSLRANDTQADPSVLPFKETAKNHNITIIPLAKAKHIELCDRGHETIHKEINRIILNFLNTTF